MPCYHPITAVQPTDGGKLSFPAPEHLKLYNDYRTLSIACGQCHGCRMTRTRHWAIRCMHEKQMHKFACYITLTYRPETLPANNTLHYPDFQRFMKRLRTAAIRGRGSFHQRFPPVARSRAQAIARNLTARSHTRRDTVNTTRYARWKNNIKFYMCGEYGEEKGRPHYHALIFGIDFADRIFYKTTPSGKKLYRSATLEKLWPYGFSSVGELTFESAAYVARYVMKKRTGDGETKEYKIIDPETAEIYTKTKEFNQMSRRSGIGSSWLHTYHQDVYATGKLIAGGHPQNPPRYYDKLYKNIDQLELEQVKHQRFIEALAYTEHQTPARLAVQEQVALARTTSLKRNKVQGA